MAVEDIERRLLILAPIGRDAQLIEAMLKRDSVECTACIDHVQLAAEMKRGAAAILVAEEAFIEFDDRFTSLISRQPPWSDIPVLILTRSGADSPAVTRALETLGNVTLLERPVRVGALSSAVRSALRARERQYQVRAHLQEREQADQRKDQFLATLAHELRNPLAPLRNSLAMLRLSNIGPAATPICEMMERQVNHMVRLVDDLIEVSRITRGMIELRKENVDVATVLNAAVETSRPLIDGARHDLTVKLPAEPIFLDADAVRLAQIFANLLNNAAKYTDPGGKIAIEARRDKGEAVIVVRDTGIGIPRESIGRVFDMFAQLNAGDSRAQTGLGIGLTLVRSLVEMHGGNVVAESEGLGCGSKFTVRLPLSARQHPTSISTPITALGVDGLQRVLVVDDNRDGADSLGALLKMLGRDVRVVYDGPSALDVLEVFHPNVIVLDLGMPGMDGYEVARRIREHRASEHATLIALTGWGEEKDRGLTQAAGFDHHFIKPVDLEAMQVVLASLAH